MKHWAFLLVILASQAAWASPQALSRCESELIMNGPTKALASYLGALLERQVIGDNELVALIDGLDQGALVNPISTSAAEVKSALLIHREKLERLLRSEALELAHLRDWAFSELKEKNRVKEKRAEAEKETQDITVKRLFHPVTELRENASKSTKPRFEVMNTTVTQALWLEVMGENPSEFQKSPSNPVENITLWSALVFANRLSELHGLPPVYDLSTFEFNRRNWREINELAAKGTLEAISGTLELDTGIPGFRLPTSSEMEYLLSDLNRNLQDGFFPGRKVDELAQQAWFSQPYTVGTRPVGQLEPFVVTTPEGSFELFDLLGNVQVWVADHRDAANRYGRSFGGAWNDEPVTLFNRSSTMRRTNDRSISIGIRLVRSLPK